MTAWLSRKLVRYAVVGVLTLAVYLAVGQGLHRVAMTAFWQGSLSFSAAVTFNYLLQRLWVFRDPRPTASSLPKYVVMISIGYVINGLCLIALYPSVPLLMAQLAAALLVILANAALSFSWVFLKRNDSDAAGVSAMKQGRLS